MTTVRFYPWASTIITGDRSAPFRIDCPECDESFTGTGLTLGGDDELPDYERLFHDHYDSSHRDQKCDRHGCDSPVAGDDTKGVPVCQQHAEESWAND